MNINKQKIGHDNMKYGLILFLFFTGLYFISTVGIMNSVDAPSYALTQAIVDKHTTVIDDFMDWCWPDVAIVNDKHYSIRPIGLSLLAIPFYILGKAIKPLAFDLLIPGGDVRSSIEVFVVLLSALSGGVVVYFVYEFSHLFINQKQTSFLAAVIFGLGTLFWKYSASFYRHSLFIALLMISIYMLLEIKKKPHKWKILCFSIAVGILNITDSTGMFYTMVLLTFLAFIFWQEYKRIFFINIIFSLLIVGVIYGTTLFYNYFSFGKLSINLYNKVPQKSWMDVSAIFSSPLLNSMYVNLFSNRPIPREALSEVFFKNRVAFESESVHYAMTYPYKGILWQSPYLLLAVIGLIYAFKDRSHVLLLLLSASFILINFISMSAYIDYYNPNSYDGRFFLPMVTFISLGTGNWLKLITSQRNDWWRTLLWIITIWLVTISIYNGWHSNLTHYSPHVTGEMRFDLSRLKSGSGASIFVSNFSDIVKYTFPNLPNILALLAIYLFAAIIYIQVTNAYRRWVFIQIKK